ncbi:hypothetical protein [Gemmata massiliana]|nr:hypothetical protein [Gemmata massiliana]
MSKLALPCPSVKRNLTPIRSAPDRFVFVNAEQAAYLRGELLRRLAALRPGRGASNVGLTPHWRLEEIRQLEQLCDRLGEAAEVRP